jgi:hypothetical protein
MGVHLMGMHLAGMCLMGMYLMGVGLMGVCLIGVYLVGCCLVKEKAVRSPVGFLGKTYYTPPYVIKMRHLSHHCLKVCTNANATSSISISHRSVFGDVLIPQAVLAAAVCVSPPICYTEVLALLARWVVTLDFKVRL